MLPKRYGTWEFEGVIRRRQPACHEFCRGFVPAYPSTNPVEQPIDLLFNRPAHTTLLRVNIKAWPISLLVSSLFNRLQGKITPAALRSSRNGVGYIRYLRHYFRRLGSSWREIKDPCSLSS
jgi:hypothetical protein